MESEKAAAGGGLLQRLDILLGIAGILMIIGGFGPWGLWFGVPGAVYTGVGVALPCGILILFGAAVTFGVLKGIEEAQGLRPLINAGAGALGGLIGLVWALISTSWAVSIGWGLILTILAGLFALFVSFMIYRKERGLWKGF